MSMDPRPWRMPIGDDRTERRVLPALRIPFRHHIRVAVEHDGGPALSAPNHTDDVAQVINAGVVVPQLLHFQQDPLRHLTLLARTGTEFG